MKRRSIQVVNEPLTLKAPNGQELLAPLGLWVLAMYDLMEDADRSLLFDRVLMFRDEVKEHPITLAGQMAGFDPSGGPIQLRTPRGPHLVGDPKTEQPSNIPSRIQVDRKGKRHIRMFCEPGKYFKKDNDANPQEDKEKVH